MLMTLRQQEEDSTRQQSSTTGRCNTGTLVETPRHRCPACWWIQFLQIISKLIWCVLWKNVVGNPLQLVLIGGGVSIRRLLLPTTFVAGTPFCAGAVTIPTKLTNAETARTDSDDDHRRGIMMVPSEKETTIATSSPSSSSARRTSNELLSSFGSTTSANNKGSTIGIGAKHCHPVVVLYDDNDDDASHNSNIDAYLARKVQTKQVTPIQSIIVTFRKTIDNHCTTDDGGGSNHHNGDQNRHRLDVQHHLFDNDDWSVLTTDPTLQAISRRLAEGLITYSDQPHCGLSAMMMVGPGNSNDDAAAADDLSEIAPLDLVSL
jgi:hypothetical protein